MRRPRHFRLRALLASLGAVAEFIGLGEIAEMFAVSKQTAVKYSQREDFPEPVERLVGGRIWRRAEVEAWGRENLPLRTGRPPKRR